MVVVGTAIVVVILAISLMFLISPSKDLVAEEGMESVIDSDSASGDELDSIANREDIDVNVEGTVVAIDDTSDSTPDQTYDSVLDSDTSSDNTGSSTGSIDTSEDSTPESVTDEIVETVTEEDASKDGGASLGGMAEGTGGSVGVQAVCDTTYSDCTTISASGNYAIALLLLTVVGGFFVMRRKN
jgi:hypothetical protein